MSTDFPGTPDLGDWISQAEASRLHGVSRQAISKLVRSGRLKTLSVGGRVLVSRSEIVGFRRLAAGRPSRPGRGEVDRVLALLETCRRESRREVFRKLREEFPIHPLEARLGIDAELLMEAIARAGPLTLRMIRGVIAEASFQVHVASRIPGGSSVEVAGNPPYDFLLDDGRGPVRVQVKLQRSKAGRPMMAREAGKRFTAEMFVVETQRTRAGSDRVTKESTRPYRFGEFDILAVCMQPSTGRWDRFLFTVANWLIPAIGSPTLIQKYQPVPPAPNADWTDRFEKCAGWFRDGDVKTVSGSDPPP